MRAPRHDRRRGRARCTPSGRSYATVAIVAVFIIPSIVVALVLGARRRHHRGLRRAAEPGDILDGLNPWLFGVDPDGTVVEAAGLEGWVYLGAAVAWIAGSAIVLARRYRSVGT